MARLGPSDGDAAGEALSLALRLRDADEETKDAFAAGRAVVARLKAGDKLTDDDRAVLDHMFEIRERMGWAD